MGSLNHVKRWKHAILPAAVVAGLALYPQFVLWISRGAEWNGAYYVSNYDETAYSAYVNALIEGKPRRTDPFAGIEEAPHESLYSIQFIPAYAIALPARWLGLSASSAFIILALVIAVGSALSLFWLIKALTEIDRLATAGTIIVLCLGTAAAFQGEFRHLITGRVLIDFLPFLRRYQPGLAFPILFLLMLFTWRAFGAPRTRRTLAYASAAGLLFAVLVFSYFYLWTAVAAWVGIAVILWLLFDRESRSQVITTAIVILAVAICALIPYFLMLRDRSASLDSVQLLTNSRQPDVASPTVLIGAALLVTILAFWWRGMIDPKDRLLRFSASLALTPVILLNQQVLTGHSLQPVHYEIFVSNYLVILSAVVLAGAVLRSEAIASKRTAIGKGMTYAAVLAAAWGFYEASQATRRNQLYAGIRDRAIPAIRYMQENEATAARENTHPVVLTPDVITGDFVPTVSTLRALWNPHTSSAGGISIDENKRLFYLYLYYSGYTENDLAEALSLNVFEAVAAIFGSERALPALGSDARAVTKAEIVEESARYRDFITRFGSADAVNPRLSYAVVAAKAEPDLGNLDRWYARDSGRDFDEFRVYRLSLRTP